MRQIDVVPYMVHRSVPGIGEYGWDQMTVETEAALILHAAGRDEEGQAFADHALGFVKY